MFHIIHSQGTLVAQSHFWQMNWDVFGVAGRLERSRETFPCVKMLAIVRHRFSYPSWRSQYWEDCAGAINVNNRN
jgi:hypothetical protein